MNPVLENIYHRRSVRQFEVKEIPESILSSVIQAGRYAPSGGNNQTTHLLAIQNPEVLNSLSRLVAQEFKKMTVEPHTYESIKNAVNAAKRGSYCFYYHAPVLIVVANRKDYGNALADSACVLENMMLAAASLELGSCWINQLHWLDENDRIRSRLQELGLHENETVCGGLALGYPAEGQLNRQPLKRVGNPVTYIR